MFFIILFDSTIFFSILFSLKNLGNHIKFIEDIINDRGVISNNARLYIANVSKFVDFCKKYLSEIV